MELIVLLLILIGVLALAYGVTKRIALFRQGSFSNKNMKIVEVLSLTPGQYLYIVEIAKSYYVFSSTKERLTYCFEIKEETLSLLPLEHKPFESYFKKFITMNREKSNDKE